MNGKRVGILVGAIGVAMLALAWVADANWESVFLEVGAALALVIAILSVEDKWRSGVETRIEQVEETVAAGIGPEQSNSSLSAFLAKPNTRRLWAIASQLSALDLETTAQVDLPAEAMVMFQPKSPTRVQLAVGARPGPLTNGGRVGIQWTDEFSIDDMLGDIREALGRAGFESASEGLDAVQLVAAAAEKYRGRFERYFDPDH